MRFMQVGHRRLGLCGASVVCGFGKGKGARPFPGPLPLYLSGNEGEGLMLKILWTMAGGTAVALGVAGIVLPLLPTTPFLLLAAFCFARSSPRLEMWLVEHPRLGPPIRHWRAEGAIAPRAKIVAVAVIAVTFGISVILQLPAPVLLIQAAVLSLVCLFLLTRPNPRPARDRDDPQP